MDIILELVKVYLPFTPMIIMALLSIFYSEQMYDFMKKDPLSEWWNKHLRPNQTKEDSIRESKKIGIGVLIGIMMIWILIAINIIWFS